MLKWPASSAAGYGMATDKTEITGEDGGPIRVELEAALKKCTGL